MPIADLPYRIERLARDGQYAYLARTPLREKPAVSGSAAAGEKPAAKRVVKTVVPTRLRVLRYVTLCDGPSLWDTIKAKKTAGDTVPVEDDEAFFFFVSLRLFATRSMVNDYLAGPEVLSHAQATGQEVPKLHDADIVISEEGFLEETASAVAEREYVSMLLSRDSNVSLESLEQMVTSAQGVTDRMPKKRGRKPKVAAAAALVSSSPSRDDLAPREDAAAADSGHSSDEDGGGRPQPDSGDSAKTASDRPSAAGEAGPPAPKPKKRPVTLRDQFALVQNTPSRVIDVSGFGDTMQHQRGRVLDRVRHTDRIAQCTALPDLFPVISDNVAGFERAMVALGPRYAPRISEFKVRYMNPVATS